MLIHLYNSVSNGKDSDPSYSSLAIINCTFCPRVVSHVLSRYKYSFMTQFAKCNEIQVWPTYCLWYIKLKGEEWISLDNYLQKDKRRRVGEIHRRLEREQRGERVERLSNQHSKKQLDDEKKLNVKEANCVFQLLIGPMGHAWGLSQ